MKKETMTTVFLVRHGETEYNIQGRLQGQLDVPLNEAGFLQAELVGKRLSNEHFDAVYSSDLARAAVTARAIAGENFICYTSLLREWNLGEWQGKLTADCRRDFPELFQQCFQDDSDIPVPGGESERQLADRSETFFRQAVKENSGKTILMVTHGGTLRAIFRRIIGKGPLTRAPLTGNTAIGIIHCFEDGSFQLCCWNDCAHLSEKPELTQSIRSFQL